MSVHCNVWPEAVIVVLQDCLSNCLYVCMIRVRCCYHFTKFHCSTLSGSEIAKCIA